MSRVINTASPGKARNQARRTIAEMLRHLMFKRSLDDETKDMASAIVFALRNIEQANEVTLAAWEKRNYFVKADRYRLEWEWVGPAARKLEETIMLGRWQELPEHLAGLAPHFADIRIAKMTRKPSTWASCYQELLHSS